MRICNKIWGVTWLQQLLYISSQELRKPWWLGFPQLGQPTTQEKLVLLAQEIMKAIPVPEPMIMFFPMNWADKLSLTPNRRNLFSELAPIYKQVRESWNQFNLLPQVPIIISELQIDINWQETMKSMLIKISSYFLSTFQVNSIFWLKFKDDKHKNPIISASDSICIKAL